MTKLGILTCEKMKQLLPYDRENLEQIRSNGIDAEAIVWDDPGVDFNKYDALLFRTTWDYYTKYAKFTQFLAEIENFGMPVFNPLHIIRGNMHKYYLRELMKSGINLIPTEFISRGQSADPEEITDRHGWEKFIIKPAVSASSYRTIVCERNNMYAARRHLSDLTRDNDVMVQKFMPEINIAGELSTFFYSDGYHYTVRKKPKQGDFRVQVDYGGVYSRDRLPSEVMAVVRSIAGKFLPEVLYIRVDGVISAGEFFLMEVEMLEPDLYHHIVPEAMPVWRENLYKKLAEKGL